MQLNQMKNPIIKLTLIALTIITIEATELFGNDATEKFPVLKQCEIQHEKASFYGYETFHELSPTMKYRDGVNFTFYAIPQFGRDVLIVLGARKKDRKGDSVYEFNLAFGNGSQNRDYDYDPTHEQMHSDNLIASELNKIDVNITNDGDVQLLVNGHSFRCKAEPIDVKYVSFTSLNTNLIEYYLFC